MARHDDHLETAIPEADRLEQEQQLDPADPADRADQQSPDPAIPEADEADRLEQAHEVLADADEEYPPNPH